MYLKIHEIHGEGTVTAACDADLLGKTLKGEFCDIDIDESFYGSELTSEKDVEEALISSLNANIIGKKVCAIAIKAGLIDESDCIDIEGIPHAQIYRV